MAAFVVDRDVLTGLMTGDVVVPHGPDYDIVRKTAMARSDDIRPAAIVRCRTPEDVSAVIRFARRAELPVAIRCGGHSVAGRSCTTGIVIDVTPMRRVSVSAGIAIPQSLPPTR
jgi:FAD/FMN-containing dehydrogenase